MIQVNAIQAPIKACLLLCLLAGMGCAAGEALRRYPEREDERTLVLPEDVSAWRPFGALALDSDGHGFAYPAVWEQGYTDSFSLLWMPLPFACRFLVAGQGGKSWLAAEASLLGALFGRDREFDWRPGIELTGRHRLAADWSFEGGALLQAEIRRVRQENFGVTAGLRAGVLWQLRPRLWVKPSLWLWVERGEVRASYLGRVPDSFAGDGTVLAPRIRLPLQLELGAAFHRQWEATLRLMPFALGYEPGYASVPAYLSLAYLW